MGLIFELNLNSLLACDWILFSDLQNIYWVHWRHSVWGKKEFSHVILSGESFLIKFRNFVFLTFQINFIATLKKSQLHLKGIAKFSQTLFHNNSEWKMVTWTNSSFMRDYNGGSRITILRIESKKTWLKIWLIVDYN